MKSILLCAFGIILGYIIGQYSSSDKSNLVIKKMTSADKNIADIDCSDHLERKMIHITDFHKAFELYFKRLGYESGSSQMIQYKELLKDPKQFIKNNTSTNDSLQSIAKNDFLSENEFLSFLDHAQTNFDYIDDDLLKKELKTKALSNPSLYFSKSILIKSFKDINYINGRFSGKLYHIVGSKKGQVDDIDLDVNFVIKDKNTITGNSSLKLLEDGVIYSHKSGNGSNGMIRRVDGNIILDAGPGIFFQFIDKKLSAAFFYEEGKLQGLVRFIKR